MSIKIVITYTKVEATGVFNELPYTCKQAYAEIYTLPIVAVARMDVLSKAGFAPCLTVTRTTIVEVN
jgi:hypothetical protein